MARKEIIKYALITFFVTVILLCAIEFLNKDYESKFQQQTKTQHDLETKCRVLEQELSESEQSRLVLGHRFDSLHRHGENLIRINHRLDSALKIKGTYAQRTPSELELEMIKRAAQ